MHSMRRGPWGILIVVLAAAAALRAIGLGFGLPAVYNPDEVAIMNRAMGLAPNGFNPHNFLYPSLYFYALFAWEGAWFVVGHLIGVFDSLASFERAFFVDPTRIYLAGRALSVVCGVATVWATWRLGARLFGRTAGLVAALLLAVAPLAVRDAHYVKHDVPVVLLIVLTHAAIADEIWRPDRRRRAWWPGLLAGLAMSTHYYAVFLAVPLALYALLPAWPDEPLAPRVRRLALAAASAAIAFLAASPFLLVEAGTALRDIVANRQIVVDRATTAHGLFGSLGFYLAWLVNDGAGRLTSALALAGLIIAARDAVGSPGTARRARVALVVAFPVVFLLFIANTVPASRYLGPVVPFVAVLAGAATSALLAREGLTRGLGYGVLACALAEGTVASLRTDLFFRATDTRTEARAWIERSIPDGASVLVQPYSVPLRQSHAGLEEALTLHLGAPERASIRFQRELAIRPYPAPSYRTIFLGTGGLDVDKIYVAPAEFDRTGSLEPLRRLAVTLVVLKRYNAEDPSVASLVRALEREGHLAARFSPYRADVDEAGQAAAAPFLHNTDARITPALERPGPVIEVWRID
jgi:hypothetical protein